MSGILSFPSISQVNHLKTGMDNGADQKDEVDMFGSSSSASGSMGEIMSSARSIREKILKGSLQNNQKNNISPDYLHMLIDKLGGVGGIGSIGNIGSPLPSSILSASALPAAY